MEYKPKDTRYPNILVPRMHLPESFVTDPLSRINHIYLIEIDDTWPTNSKYPTGVNVRSIGEMGDIAAETKGLLIQHGFHHGEFNEEVMNSLKQMLGESSTEQNEWKIPDGEVSRRKDLRHLRIFTIDPPTAKDLDDALHIEKLDNGIFEIGCHIADVSFFLREGTPLDEEARRRATSCYLVQKVIPMLPSILCEQLCSLNPNVERLAFSCIWRMHSDGSLVDENPWFGRTIIKSCAKLDYVTAQRMIDGLIPLSAEGELVTLDNESYFETIPESLWEKSRHPVGHNATNVVEDVRTLHAIAMARRHRRLSSGALVLINPKLTFKLDGDGNPEGFGTYDIRESNQLVEEYMLLANFFAAQQLLLNIGDNAFLRSHDPPDLKKMRELKEVTDMLGVELDTTTARSLQSSLNRIARNSSEETQKIVNSLLIRPMKPATYIHARTVDAKSWNHYALAIPYYTHFTSPIRRYADVIVHRLLGEIEDDIHNESPRARVNLADIANHCNEMKNSSRLAQDRSDRVYLSLYIRSHPCEVVATVIGIGERSFTVLIENYGIESRIYIDQLNKIESTFCSESKTITLCNMDCASMYTFSVMKIHLLVKLNVLLITKKKPPLDIDVQLIGLAISTPDEKG